MPTIQRYYKHIFDLWITICKSETNDISLGTFAHKSLQVTFTALQQNLDSLLRDCVLWDQVLTCSAGRTKSPTDKRHERINWQGEGEVT